MEIADAVRIGEHDAHAAVTRSSATSSTGTNLIGEHVQPGAEDRALGVDRNLGIELFVTSMTGRHQVLDAVLDPLHRPPEHERGSGHREHFRLMYAFLPNEPPMSRTRTRTLLVGVDRQQLSQMHPQGVGILMGGVKEQLTGRRSIVRDGSA